MILYLASTAIVSFAMLLILLKTPLVNLALDKPNQRSLHTKLTPRTGGLAIMFGSLFSWLLSGQSYIWILPALILVLVSIIDDIKELSIRWRFFAQILVSLGFVLVLSSSFLWWQVIVLVLAITWMINLYNFMDGSDGLAGGMAVFGFSAYAFAAYLAMDQQLSNLSGAVAVASFVFLIFNFNPAKIFMGDAGSIPLGFLAGSIGLYGWQHGLWAIWFPVLVFSPFIVDASVTLFKRLIRGEKFWQAHRSHYYQRLVQMGIGHKMTAIYEYLLMLAVAATALLLNGKDVVQVSIAIFVWILIYAAILILIDQRWKKFIQANALK